MCMPPVCFCLLICVYSLMLLCTHLSEFLMNKDVYIRRVTDVHVVQTTELPWHIRATS